jgi:hypothetical protein
MLHQLYREDLKIKERSLLMKNMKLAIIERQLVRPMRTEKILRSEPFKPTSITPKIPLQIPLNNNHRWNETKDGAFHLKEAEMEVRDDETGELTLLTKARWSGREGSLILDRSTIISVGTGKLDLIYRNNKEDKCSNSITDLPNRRNCHPLVAQFLKDGQLILRNYRHWSSKTDGLEVPPFCDTFDQRKVNTESMSIVKQDGKQVAIGITSFAQNVSAIIAEKSERPDRALGNEEVFQHYFANMQLSDALSDNEIVLSKLHTVDAKRHSRGGWKELKKKFYLDLMNIGQEMEKLRCRNHYDQAIREFPSISTSLTLSNHIHDKKFEKSQIESLEARCKAIA